MAIEQKTDNVGLKTSTALSPEEEKKKKEEEQQQLSQPSQTPISSTQAPSTPQTVTAMPKQQKAGTGTFANLRSYIQAAQGGGQQKIAGAATKKLQTEATGAKKGVEQAQRAFETQREAGSLANMGTATSDISNIVSGARSAVFTPPTSTAPVTPPEEGSEIEVEAPPVTYVSPLTAEQTARAGEVFNAQYQGPGSLQEAGLYEDVASSARKAAQAGQLAQTAQGRELLLRDIFGANRNYTRGQSKLDALLLNTAQPEIAKLQEQAKTNVAAMQQAQAAQNLSANMAAKRAREIEDIRNEARGIFTEARTAEEEAANQYIKSVQENWDRLPEYMKKSLEESATTPITSRIGDVGNSDYANRAYDATLGGVNTSNWWKGRRERPFTVYNLSAEEAAILGVEPGSPMFFDPEDISSSPLASGEELITKNQLYRQLALAELAKTDLSNALQKDLMYSDLEKAGTKDILSSLDTKKLLELKQKRKENFEKTLSRQDRAIGTSGGYKPFDYLKELENVGYTKLNEEKSPSEDYQRDVLRKILQGENLEQTTELSPDLVQRIYENVQGVNINQKVNLLQDLQDYLAENKGATAQVYDNEQTRARNQALQELLNDIYKIPE